MNEKHFIWIVPMLLVIGFFVGYISGLNMPEKITFEVDKDSRDWLDSFANNTINNECYITQTMCERDIMNKDNSFRYCVMNLASEEVIKSNGTGLVRYDLLQDCSEIVDTMPGLLYD